MEIPSARTIVSGYVAADAAVAGDPLLVGFGVARETGPLAVRPDRQGLGLGKAVVTAAVDWLRDVGVTTLGLETMPRTVENIGFYSIYPDPDTHVEVVTYGHGGDAISRLFTIMTGDGTRVTRPLKWVGAVLRHPLKSVRLLWPWGWSRRSTGNRSRSRKCSASSGKISAT